MSSFRIWTDATRGQDFVQTREVNRDDGYAQTQCHEADPRTKCMNLRTRGACAFWKYERAVALVHQAAHEFEDAAYADGLRRQRKGVEQAAGRPVLNCRDRSLPERETSRLEIGFKVALRHRGRNLSSLGRGGAPKGARACPGGLYGWLRRGRAA